MQYKAHFISIKSDEPISGNLDWMPQKYLVNALEASGRSSRSPFQREIDKRSARKNIFDLY